MVGGVLQESILQHIAAIAAKNHPHTPHPRPQRAALSREHIASQGIEPAEEFAGLKIDVFVAPLELVEFLEHRERDRHIMFFEIMDAAVVVEDHIGVEDKDLGRCILHGKLLWGRFIRDQADATGGKELCHRLQ